MKLPIVPFVIAVTLLSAVVYLFTATRSNHRTLDVPRLTRLADIDGIETEVAIAPDGNRFAVIVSGDLWVLNISTGARQQITHTPELESFPAWSPDGKRIAFTRGSDTFVIDAEAALGNPSSFINKPYGVCSGSGIVDHESERTE